MHWPGRLAELIEDWVYLIRPDGWRSALPEVGRVIVTLPYRHMEFTVLARRVYYSTSLGLRKRGIY